MSFFMQIFTLFFFYCMRDTTYGPTGVALATPAWHNLDWPCALARETSQWPVRYVSRMRMKKDHTSSRLARCRFSARYELAS